MEKLNIHNIKNITWVEKILKDHLIVNWKRIVIFEYLSNFHQPIFSEFTNTFGKSIEIKVIKSKFHETVNELLEKEFLIKESILWHTGWEFGIVTKKKSESTIKPTGITTDLLDVFKSHEKGEDYIYRHYLSIEAEDDNINSFALNILEKLNNENLIIRLLGKEDIQKHLASTLQSSFIQNEDDISEFNMTWANLIEKIWLKRYKVFSAIDRLVNKRLNRKKEILDDSILEPLNQSIWKDESWLDFWTHFIWALEIKWLPKQEFNVLKFISLYLDEGDSIGISISPSADNTKTNLQLFLYIKDLNKEIIDSKLDKIKNHIGYDFYSDRVIARSSRLLSNYTWCLNKDLNSKKQYDSHFIKNNLIF